MWPFKKQPGIDELEARVIVLESQISTMRNEYLASQDKVTEAVNKMLCRAGARDYQAQQAAERDELKNILGNVDIAALFKDPEGMKAALSNPALIQFALKKFGKELI